MDNNRKNLEYLKNFGLAPKIRVPISFFLVVNNIQAFSRKANLSIE